MLRSGLTRRIISRVKHQRDEGDGKTSRLCSTLSIIMEGFFESQSPEIAVLFKMSGMNHFICYTTGFMYGQESAMAHET